MAISRPSSDFSNIGWTDQNGASSNIYAAIGETVPNFATWAQCASSLFTGDPTGIYTVNLSTAPVLASGDQYAMACYADAAYTMGGARDLLWELLDGSTVIASTVLSVTNSPTIPKFTFIVSVSVTSITTPRFRWTWVGDGTDKQADVYYAELGSVFTHLDIGTNGFDFKVASPGSGNYLIFDPASSSYIRKSGNEDPTALILTSSDPFPHLHG